MSVSVKNGVRGVELGSAPASPAAGQRLLYPKSDGWYQKDSAGVETKLTGLTGTKVSALTAATAANSAMEVPVNDGGVNRKLTLGQAQDYLGLIKGVVSADHAISATAATACTLSPTPVLGVGTWMFQFNVIVQSATITVSPKIGINHTGTVTTFMAMARFIDTVAAPTTAQGLAGASTAGTPSNVDGMQAVALSTTAPNILNSVGTNALSVINTNALWVIEGIMVVTASGNLELWHGSETATSTTVKQNSSFMATKTA